MLSNKSNKELVEAGHQFAKALDADMPLTEIAKLVSDLSTRLDCAIVRGDELQQKLDAMAAENAALKSDLMFWDAEDPESPYECPEDIANSCCIDVGMAFDVQVAARMPDRTYRVSSADDYDRKIELVSGGMPETPTTDAYLNSVRVPDETAYCNECGGSN